MNAAERVAEQQQQRKAINAFERDNTPHTTGRASGPWWVSRVPAEDLDELLMQLCALEADGYEVLEVLGYQRPHGKAGVPVVVIVARKREEESK